MAARICPNCKRRVDERVSKGLAVCLSCGSSLDAPPRVSLSSAPPMSGPVPSQMQGQMSARSPGPPSAYGPASYGPSTYGVTSANSGRGSGLPVNSGRGSGLPAYGSAPFTPHSMPSYGPPPPRAEPKKSSGAGTVIVVLLLVGAFAVMAIGVVAFFLFRAEPSTSSSGPVSTSTVVVETPESTDTTTEPNPKEHPTSTGHAKPPPIPTITVPHPTSSTTSGLPPFPFALAIEKMDEATASAEKECAFPSGPFGTTVVDVTFETDGRVGTLSRKPIGGTPTGSCITAKFLAIHVGAFEGSSRTFSRAVTITAPIGSPTATPTGTGSSRTTGRDAGR